MARTTTTTSAKNTVTTEYSVVTDEKKAEVLPLMDEEEIEVKSLVPNVSYRDSKTEDIFEWESIGDVENMSVAILKNLWKKHKGYFRDFILKVEDKRIIKLFSLDKLYDDYGFIFDENNYTAKKIDKVCEIVDGTTNSIRSTFHTKIVNLINSEKLNDLKVIRAIERCLDVKLL